MREHGPERPLPGLRYTHEQLLFIAFAQVSSALMSYLQLLAAGAMDQLVLCYPNQSSMLPSTGRFFVKWLNFYIKYKY